jgi:hypothetical protein
LFDFQKYYKPEYCFNAKGLGRSAIHVECSSNKTYLENKYARYLLNNPGYNPIDYGINITLNTSKNGLW